MMQTLFSLLHSKRTLGGKKVVHINMQKQTELILEVFYCYASMRKP